MVVSDCSTNAWAVPARCEKPHFIGDDELVVDSTLPAEMLAQVGSVRIRQMPDVVYRRRETCTMTVEYEGSPCSDYRCSRCGKVHNTPRVGPFCPRCGASVTSVIGVGEEGEPGPVSDGEEELPMMEVYAEMTYYVDQHGELPERIVVHDTDGEMSDVYYRRCNLEEQVEVKELET